MKHTKKTWTMFHKIILRTPISKATKEKIDQFAQFDYKNMNAFVCRK